MMDARRTSTQPMLLSPRCINGGSGCILGTLAGVTVDDINPALPE